MTLGKLKDELDATCFVYRWPGAYQKVRKIAAQSKKCESIFCSDFAVTSKYMCDAQLGSPVICGDEKVVNGFVSNEGNCVDNNIRTKLNMHSVEQYRDFINDPANYNSAITQKTSILLILSALIIAIKKF
jgi:hypothetical protein